MEKILIVIKIDNNKLKIVHQEILSHFSKFKTHFKIYLIIFCQKINNEILETLKYYDLEKITIYENKKNDIMHSSSFIDIIINVLKKYNFKYIVSNNSIFSKDIGGVISEVINGLWENDIISVENENGILKLKKYIYGSTCYRVISCNEEKAFITISPNNFFNDKSQKFNNAIEIKNFSLKETEIKVISREENSFKEETPLREAKIIVAGGYGIKKKEDISLLYDVAKAVNGSVGVSRALVDKGFFSRSKQIGQSGKSVSPNIIFNFGISGQRQFTAGIDGAKTIISINKDEKATIFQYSDYGVVGDLYEVIPILIKKLKEMEW